MVIVIVHERNRSFKPGCEQLHPQRYPNEPSTYLAWMDWAEEMSKTHKQEACPHCKRWVIWEPKKKREKSSVSNSASS